MQTEWLGVQDVIRILNHLCTNHVFTFASADGSSYRYHNLFREFLRRKSAQEDGAQKFREQQLRAAEMLQDAEEFEMATELYFSANLPVAALDVLARAGESAWMRADRNRCARGSHGCRAFWPHPTLGRVSWRAKSCFATAIMTMRWTVCELRSRCSRSPGTNAAVPGPLGLGVHAVLEGRHRRRRRPVPRRACSRLDRRGADSLARESRRGTRACVQVEGSRASFGAGRGYRRTHVRTRAGAGLSSHRVNFMRLHGWFRRAMSVGKASVEPMLRDAPVNTRAPFLNLLAILATYLGEYAAAAGHVAECAAIRQRWGFDPLLHGQQDTEALLLFAAGHFEDACSLIRAGSNSESGPIDASDRRSYLCHLGTGWRRRGDLPQALSYYEKAAAVAGVDVEPSTAYAVLVNREYVFGLNDPCRDLDTLEALRLATELMELHFASCKCEFFRTVLLHTRGRVEEALAEIAAVVPTQLELGHINFLSQELNAYPQLAVDMLDAETRPDIRAGVIDASRPALVKHESPQQAAWAGK